MPRRKSTLPSEVFLSHASADRKFADELAHILRSHGIPVWYSESDIVGAQRWHDEIGKALARCDWFLLVLSPTAVKSRWVGRELTYALNESRFDDHIIPVIHRPCDPKRLSWTLPSMEYVDFTQSKVTGIKDLLRVWGIGYRSE